MPAPRPDRSQPPQDGVKWYTLTGTCSGVGMSKITFNFSSKGGPASLTGAASLRPDGTAIITWPDGNVWERLAAPGALLKG